MINLADYTPAMKTFIRERAMACVYVLALPAGSPVRIGHATDIHNHLSTMLSTTPYEIFVRHLIWTPGKMVAVVIENAVRHELQTHHLRQKWFDLQAEAAIERVTSCCSRLFPGANLVPHERIIGQLRASKPFS